MLDSYLSVQDTLVGGVYSTSATIEWALAELVRHPGVLEKVQLEMSEVVGPYHIVEDAEISQLPYFQVQQHSKPLFLLLVLFVRSTCFHRKLMNRSSMDWLYMCRPL